MLSTASVAQAITFDTLTYGMAPIPQRNLHVLGSDEVQ